MTAYVVLAGAWSNTVDVFATISVAIAIFFPYPNISAAFKTSAFTCCIVTVPPLDLYHLGRLPKGFRSI